MAKISSYSKCKENERQTNETTGRKKTIVYLQIFDVFPVTHRPFPLQLFKCEQSNKIRQSIPLNPSKHSQRLGPTH